MKLKKYSCLAPNPELLKNLETQMYFFLLLSFLLFLFPSFEFRFENRFKVTTETRKYDEPIKLRKFVEPFYKLKNILESFLNSTKITIIRKKLLETSDLRVQIGSGTGLAAEKMYCDFF